MPRTFKYMSERTLKTEVHYIDIMIYASVTSHGVYLLKMLKRHKTSN